MRFFILTFISFLFSSSVFSQEETQPKYIKNYNEQHILIEEGWMKNGEKMEYWYTYYNDGSIKSKGNYKNDKKHGYWFYYSDLGKVQYEGHYENGNKTKWWITYDTKGVVTFKCQYQDNIKQGYSLCYKNGKLVKSEKYENNTKVDEWTSLWKFKLSNNLEDLK